jgi:hypothetical protein
MEKIVEMVNTMGLIDTNPHILAKLQASQHMATFEHLLFPPSSARLPVAAHIGPL